MRRSEKEADELTCPSCAARPADDEPKAPCPFCIRSCLVQCSCGPCREADQPIHHPRPAPATKGRLCHRCAQRLTRWLDTLLDDTLTLDARIPADYSWNKSPGKAQKITGSPALLLLDIVALTDPRTYRPDDTDPDYTGPMLAIPKVICGWAEVLAGDHNLASPTGTMQEAMDLLTAWWGKLTEATWIAEFYDDVQLIHQLLNRAHNVEPPAPRGRCFTCDTELWAHPGSGSDTVTCRKCQRSYDGMSIVALEIQRRRDAANLTKGQV